MIKQYLSSSIVCKPVAKVGSESFELTYSGGKIYIQAGSEIVSLWAARLARAALESGCIYEILGKTEPLFPLRPLWIQSGNLKTQIEKWIPFGFNALVLEDEEIDPIEGIKIIRKPKDDEFSPSNLSCDYLLWESRCNNPAFFENEDLTRIEILVEEMKRLEDNLGGAKLIYYLPKHQKITEDKQCRWLMSLCQRAGKNTIIAFSHPTFWKAIRKTLVPITVPLLPIITPDITVDALGRLFSQMQSHNFYGLITKIMAPPKDQLPLWVIGQLQLRGGSPHHFADNII